RLDREDGRVLRRAGERDVLARDRRRDKPPVRDAIGVPGPPPPELAAIGGIVRRQVVAARDEDRLAPLPREGNRRGESLERLRARLARPHMPPERFPRIRIHRQEIGLVLPIAEAAAVDRAVALEDLQIELVLPEERARREGPQEGE